VSTYPKKQGAGPWGPLADALARAEVPSLDVPSTLPEALRSSAADAAAPDLGAAQQRRAEALEQVARPSFAETTVTNLAHPPDATTDDDAGGDASGFGTGFGRALHVLFEEAVRHRHGPHAITRDHVRALLDMDPDAPSHDEAVRHAQALLDALHASDFWPAVQTASRVLTEYPVSGFAEPQVSSSASSLHVRGFIDLAYRTADGWHLVDYKTDRVATVPAALDRFDAYVRQVQTYTEMWNASHEVPIRRALLWFADANVCAPVDGA
jgi:ATP-dependent helicase/nuclease subunit A